MTARGAWGLTGLALLAWALLACSPAPPDRLAEARRLVQGQDRAAAIVVLKSLIVDEPTLAAARWMLGDALLADGDAAGAQIELDRALALGQAQVDVVPLLAQALLAQGKPQAVVAQFGSVQLPQAQAAADLHCALAQAQASLDDLPAARESLAQALLAVPGHEQALRLSARVAAAGGDHAAALQGVQALLTAHPASADGWVLKGDLLGQQPGSSDPAIGAYRQALVHRPQHAGAHGALISLLLARRDAAGAASQLQAMQQALPRHPQTAFFEGQLALTQGDLPRARDRFQNLLRGTPNNLSLLQSAAAVELRAQAPAQAESLLNKAMQLAPAAASTRRMLARAQLALGQPAKALATLASLTAPDSKDAEALQLMAQARLLSGDVSGAQAAFNQARALRPDDPGLRTAVAMGQFKQGRVEPAIAELKAVAETDPGPDADLALMAAEMSRNAFAGALQAVARLEAKQPGKAMPSYLRGQVLLRRGDEAQARQAFEQAVEREPSYLPAVVALASLDVASRQPARARARMDALIESSPGNPAAYLAAAEVMARGGASRDEVTALLDRAVKAQPADLAAWLALVDHHLATQNAKAAQASAQAALTALPDQPELLSRLGWAQLVLAGHAQAATTFSRLLALQPRSVVGHLGLAEAQAAAGDSELPAAARSARRALDLAPGSLKARKLAIALALRQRQPAQALALARELQKLQPAGATGLVLEAEIEAKQGHWDAALAPLRKAVALADPEQAPERLHHLLRQAGRAAEADSFAAQWQRDHPKDALFLFYLGDLALARKDYAVAQAHYQAVLTLKPDHPLALNNVAWLRLNLGQPGALGFAERAVAAAPNNPALLDTLALALAAEQQWPRAIGLQLRALEMRPTDAFMRLNLARLYAQSGDKRQAQAELDRLAALGPDFSRQGEVATLRQSLGGR